MSKTAKENCDICTDNINKVNKKITCVYCAFASCMRCAKRYITSESSACCMSCKKEWNDDFLDENFPKTFLNKEYKNHMEGIEFAKQEALLPQTMVAIENEKRKNAILAQIHTLKDQILQLEIEYNRVGTPGAKSPEVDEPKVSLIKQCPSEKCNGYLNSKYECGICDLVVCVKCEQIKADDDHVCDAGDIETVKMKKKECKYCPNCSRETFKDGGCYQIWCPPPCNGGKGTAWDFNSGKIDKGGVHAPLYYQYMRENRVNEGGANGCVDNNELVPIHLIDNQIRAKRLGFDRESFSLFLGIHRSIVDVRYHLMDKYETRDDIFETHLDIRMKFLKNEISKESFNKTLMMRLKAKKKKSMIYENLEMLENVSNDIFHRLYTTTTLAPRNSTINLAPFLTELDKIREYYNVSISKTKARFAIKKLDVGYMNDRWEMKSK